MLLRERKSEKESHLLFFQQFMCFDRAMAILGITRPLTSSHCIPVATVFLPPYKAGAGRGQDQALSRWFDGKNLVLGRRNGSGTQVLLVYMVLAFKRWVFKNPPKIHLLFRNPNDSVWHELYKSLSIYLIERIGEQRTGRKGRKKGD